MIKSKKAFTLIELLAVIIILAIIALIATPIVLNIVNDSKEKARIQSVTGYADSVKLSYTEELMNKTGKSLKQLADSKMQGEEVVCEYVGYHAKEYGTLLHTCTVKSQGNYCFINGKVYDNKAQKCNEVYEMIVGQEAPNTILKVEQSGAEIASGYTWATEKVIKVSYPNIDNTTVKYFKSSAVAIVEPGVIIESCGMLETPSECNSESQTVLAPNTWYKTGKTTVNVKFNEQATLQVLTTDENNILENKIHNIEQVSSSEPSVPEITGGGTNWSTSKVISIAKESIANSGISHYQYYVSYPTDSITGGEWIDLEPGVTSVEITSPENISTYDRRIYFRAVANNGKVSQNTTYQSVHIDGEKPKVTVQISGKIITINITDSVGISGYKVLNSNELEPTTFDTLSDYTAIEYVAQEPGEYKVWTKDLAGNIASEIFTIEQNAFEYEATLSYTCPNEKYTLDETNKTCTITEYKQDASCGTTTTQKKCGYYLGNETVRSDGMCTYSCTLNPSHGVQEVYTCGFLPSGARCNYITGTTTTNNSCDVTTTIDATETYICPNGGTLNGTTCKY